MERHERRDAAFPEGRTLVRYLHELRDADLWLKDARAILAEVSRSFFALAEGRARHDAEIAEAHRRAATEVDGLRELIIEARTELGAARSNVLRGLSRVPSRASALRRDRIPRLASTLKSRSDPVDARLKEALAEADRVRAELQPLVVAVEEREARFWGALVSGVFGLLACGGIFGLGSLLGSALRVPIAIVSLLAGTFCAFVAVALTVESTRKIRGLEARVREPFRDPSGTVEGGSTEGEAATEPATEAATEPAR